MRWAFQCQFLFSAVLLAFVVPRAQAEDDVESKCLNVPMAIHPAMGNRRCFSNDADGYTYYLHFVRLQDSKMEEKLSEDLEALQQRSLWAHVIGIAGPVLGVATAVLASTVFADPVSGNPNFALLATGGFFFRCYAWLGLFIESGAKRL
ncbi:MAG: hypothetical protein IPJ88_05895 [Myxococcales bacterium]|nr:MAG: hypothetical protein IPJ88_05895 [Myxococcales bacterium]